MSGRTAVGSVCRAPQQAAAAGGLRRLTGARPPSPPPSIYLLSMVSAVAALVPAFAVADVVLSATRRGRLTGTTFKVLNAGLLANAAVLFVAEALNEAWPFGLRLLYAVASGAVAALNLKDFGFPAFEFEFKDALGCAYGALSGLAVLSGTALVAMSSALSRSLEIEGLDVTAIGSHTIITFGGFCFLLFFLFHVLQSAAAAGPKRLSSATYKELNLAGALASAIMICGVLASIGMGFTGTLLAWAALLQCGGALVACSAGFWIGHTYAE